MRAEMDLSACLTDGCDPRAWASRVYHADYLSPSVAYAWVRTQTDPPVFLLESAEGPEKIARFSIIAGDPLTTVIGSFEADDPVWPQFERACRQWFATDLPDEWPTRPFLGWYGYVAYEMTQRFERIAFRHPRDLAIPDFAFMFPGQLVVFDHRQRTMHHWWHRSRTPWTWRDPWSRVSPPLLLPRREPRSDFRAEPTLSMDEFAEMVGRARQYIREGDIFQVVLSQRFERPWSGDPWPVYRVLRNWNPSPYLFYLDYGTFVLLGSSPEMLVRQVGDTAWIRPIAGTRRRGRDEAEDQRLVQELCQDAKERAEHVMLVDLARHDLGQIAVPGTVRVTRLMEVETYSHVFHLTSEVQATVRPDVSPLQVLAAGFPAGTVTGAPKIRAMEIIDELEPVRRQFYAGGVGYVGANRRMDFCITIRTGLVTDGRLIVQAGAGIVWDSDPRREYRECQHKAGALLQAAEEVEVGSR
jgi:anthranilate synthase component 1